jgi:predicted permease
VLTPLRLVVDPRSQGHNYFSFGRLAPEVTHAQLVSEVTAFTDRFDRAHPGIVDEQASFRVIAYNEFLVGDRLRTAIWVLFAAVTAVLLIACANVTNLLLGRADGRRRELAVRAALGAGRFRIISHLLTESLLLAFMGGGLGLLFARWWLEGILAFAPEGIPGLERVELSIPVLGFALAVSVVTGILVGLGGSVSVLRQDVASTLKEAGRAQTGAPGRVQARGLLIMMETAFAVVLLIGAALLLVSFHRLRAVEPGFDPEGVYTIEMRIPADRYATTEATWRFESEVLAALRALPGVAAAGSASNLPLVRGLNSGATVVSDGERQHDIIEFRAVSPDFLGIVGVPVLRGRGFTEADRAGAPPVALVNEAFVRRFFADGEPLGAQVSVDGPDRTVVGVLGDTKDMGLRRDPWPTVFAPRAQASDGATRGMNEWFIAAFAIRAQNATALVPALRRAVQQADPEQPILRMRPMREVVESTIANEQFNARLLATFGGLALLLTAIGVYGVVSYSVGRRTHEIGLRMALGARRSRVVGLVVRQVMAVVAIGLTIGLVAAFALSRLLAGILFGVGTTDPATFLAVTLLIAGVALIASYIPARRASRVDPLTALRAD